MILGDGKYQGLPDGLVMNNDTGEIYVKPYTKRKGKDAKPYYSLKMDDGSKKWYTCEWIAKHYHELNNLEMEETPIPLENEEDAVSFHTIDPSKGLAKTVMDLLDE